MDVDFIQLNRKPDDTFQTLEEYLEHLKTNVPDRSIHHGKYEVKEVRRKVRRGEIPIGCYDKKYTTGLKTISIQGESLRLIVSGRIAGCGKTTFLSNILIDGINMYLDRYRDENIGRIVFDFKNELIHRREAAYQLSDQIYKINYPGFRPRGCGKLIQVAPYFLKNRLVREYQEKPYYTQYDTDKLSISDIEKMFRLDSQTRNRSDETSRNVLTNMVFGGYSTGKEYSPENHAPSSELMRLFSKKIVKNESLKGKLQLLLRQKILGNTFNNCSVIDLLNDGRIVCYITPKDMQKKRYGQAYVGVEMERIIRARQNYRLREAGRLGKKFKGDVLENKTVMYFPEFDNYMPKGNVMPTTKRVLRDVYNEERYNAISVFADTPSFSSIDDLSLEQSHYIFSFQITPKQAGRLKQARYLTDTHLEDLYNLDYTRNQYPNECACIDDNVDRYGHLETFYPLPPLSNPQASTYA